MTSSSPRPDQIDSRSILEPLQQEIDQAANLLPLSGPITAFAFLNTLQALEDLPFVEGLIKGARLYGCEPFLSEERYREKLARGRIRVDDLAAVVRKDLGSRANEPIGGLGTRWELRLAMLLYPLRFGPPEELLWFVTATDALQKFREEAPRSVRARFIDETQHWVMRDLRDAERRGRSRPAQGADASRQSLLPEILERFEESSIETWTEDTWEALALQVLWRVCRDGVRLVEPQAVPEPPAIRHRDFLKEAVSADSDELVHAVLIRFCAPFTDQGFADWQLPNRDEGFYRAFMALYREPARPPEKWMRGLAPELSRLEQTGLTPLESIAESLELLGVGEAERSDYITFSLLALRGWAGMLWHMETRPDRVPIPVPAGTIVEFLAAQLILERVALAFIAREQMGYDGPLQGLRQAARAATPKRQSITVEQRAFLVFQVAQVMGWSPPAMCHLKQSQWAALVAEIKGFNGLERRRSFHLAFERRFRVQTLDAISVHAQRPLAKVESPRFQAVFCIDAREESFRRHLEEFAPEAETFGRAGFFCIPMYFRGVADAHYTALCPIVIKPQHWVVEDVVYPLEEDSLRRARTRRALGTASHQFHVGSRSIFGGALFAAGLGVLASVPLVFRVLFPRLAAEIRRTAGQLVQPPPITRLRLERSTPTAGPEEEQIGFTVVEMANLGECVLRDIGLTSGMSRLVMFLGHGSFCLNNPHKSAYDCGACSGSAGSPNARALAAFLNDRRVREILADRGLAIPAETWFVGGLHNTGNDSVSFFDLDQLPKSHLADFKASRLILDEVCERNAHERCRRFQSAPLDLTGEEAREHVEVRCEDLAQTRPEFGNAYERHMLRRPPGPDSRAVSRPALLPELVRSDAGRRREHDPGANSRGRRAGLRRHQHAVLPVVRRSVRLGLRHQAAAQRHVAVGRDERRGQRFAARIALAGRRDPRARAAAVRHRDHAPGHAANHGTQPTGRQYPAQWLGPIGRAEPAFGRDSTVRRP